MPKKIEKKTTKALKVEKKSAADKKKMPKTFDLLGDDTFATTIKEGLLGVKGISIIQTRNPREGLLKIPPFFLQCVLRTWGFLNGTMVDVLGGEGLGKTALMLTVGGWAMRQNSPFLLVETENKPIFDLNASRTKRCLHSNRAKADIMLDRMGKVQAFEIKDAINAIETWAVTVRQKVPLHIPIVAALDTFSKLMGSSEAAAFAMYGDEDVDEKKIKELGGGSNFEAAKLAQAWCRRLPRFLKQHNMILFLARHQNDKVDMAQKFGGGGGITLSPEVADTLNKTSRGGRAFSQSAALQIILSKGRQATASVNGQNVKIGENIRMTVAKSSFGPSGVKCDYRLMQVARQDTEEYQEPVLNFAPHFPEWLLMNRLLTIQKKNLNCYSCKELGLMDVDTETFTTALENNEDLLCAIGNRLDMIGYTRDQLSPPVITPENASSEPEEVPQENSQEAADEPAAVSQG